MLSALTGMSAAADQYALATVTWQMLTGASPVAGESPPLSVSRPDLPTAVGTVLEHALARKPADRYPTATKFYQSFRNAVEGRPSGPVRVTEIRKTDKLLLGPENTTELPPAEPKVAKKKGGPRNSVILGALGAATALTLLALLAWRANSDDPLTPTERQRLVQASQAFEAPADSATSTSPAGGTVAPVPPARPAPPEAPEKAAESRDARLASLQRTREQRRTDAAERSRVTARGTGWVTIGTNPQAAIFVNDTPVPTNPVRNWPVPAGAVFLRFEVLDNETGVWTRDMVVNLAAGDTLNLGRIRLTRP